MYISLLNNVNANNNTNFKSKNEFFTRFLNSEKINEKITQINKNEDTRELFKGLSAIAASAVAGIIMFAEKNESAKKFLNHVIDDLGLNQTEEKEKNKVQEQGIKLDNKEELENISKLLKENPERNLYLKVTSYFPKLNDAYKNLLEEHAKEPENQENDYTLYMVENMFAYLAQPDKLKGTKSYFQALNDNADVLSKITTNVTSTLKNGNSLMYYLVLLNNGKLKKEDIVLWAKAENLSCDEFMMFKGFGADAVLKLNELKNKYDNKFKITELNEHGNNNAPINNLFKLNFDNEIELNSRLKIVKTIHEIMYGKVCFNSEKDEKSKYVEHDIQRELLDNIIKDRRMDSTFTFVKFINPDALKGYNLTAQDVKFLSKDDKKYKEIYKICMENIMNLDFENLKFKALCEVIRDNEIFGELIESNHSRMRFLTRFVLKNNPNPKNLRESCKLSVNKFYDELKDNSDKCNYFCYFHPKGTAPQFYLSKSCLGNYIKITLNSEGKIHTIYEDINKEAKKQ